MIDCYSVRGRGSNCYRVATRTAELLLKPRTLHMRFQVQVWTGRMSAAADQADDLADSDGLSFVDHGPGDHVAVAGYGAVDVLDLDVPVFSAPDLGRSEVGGGRRALCQTWMTWASESTPNLLESPSW